MYQEKKNSFNKWKKNKKNIKYICSNYADFDDETYPHLFYLRREHDQKQMMIAIQYGAHDNILLFSEEVL